MPILVQKKCLICGEKILTGEFNDHLLSKHQIDLNLPDTGIIAGRISLPPGYNVAAAFSSNAFVEVYSNFLKLFPGKSFNIISDIGLGTNWLLIENTFVRLVNKKNHQKNNK